MTRPADPDGVPGWLVATLLGAIAANALASWTTRLTIELMSSASEFARASRQHELSLLRFYTPVAFATMTTVALAYLWSIVAALRRSGPIPVAVQRRVVSAPLVIALLGFGPWVTGPPFFVTATVLRFGHWSTELMSQQLLSPMVNGFLAATVTFLLVDLVFRRAVVPRVFPTGGVADVPGALALGVRGRLIVLLIAVGFVPLFTLFGLVRSAVVRLEAGMPVDAVVPQLDHAGGLVFFVFLILGVGLTLALARTITDPLEGIAATLRRIRAGDLGAPTVVTSSDEIGVVEDGVNALLAALVDRERILATFGRVVEPAVRDRLLAGDLRAGGELRTATVLFCDLRDFTALAERTPANELVETLNGFFTAMTGWVRECGGFVDKFIGDALLVVFGLFDADQPDAGAAAAVRCARGMRERLALVNADRTAAGRAVLRFKIGVHTGEVVAGTIGAADRHEFTVVGDTVNVAARLEALCREHGAEVLVSEHTYRLATAAGDGCPVTIEAAVALRGRDAAVRVFGIA